jgi:hypothetical protein
VRPGKTRVYVAIPGPAPAELRSALAVGLRDANIRSKCRTAPTRNVCGYTGAALGFESMDVEHKVEGQMDGHAIAYCENDELRLRLRQVDLALPGQVRNSVFLPYYSLHNDPLNVTFASHQVNMRKEGATKSMLNLLDKGQSLSDSRGLHAELLRTLSAPLPKGASAVPMTGEEAARCAAAIVGALRDMEDAYVARLTGVAPHDPGLAMVQPGQRRRVVQMYGDLGEEVGQLYGALGL